MEHGHDLRKDPSAWWTYMARTLLCPIQRRRAFVRDTVKLCREDICRRDVCTRSSVWSPQPHDMLTREKWLLGQIILAWDMMSPSQFKRNILRREEMHDKERTALHMVPKMTDLGIFLLLIVTSKMPHTLMNWRIPFHLSFLHRNHSKRTRVLTITLTRRMPMVSRRRSAPSTFPREEWTQNFWGIRNFARSTITQSAHRTMNKVPI